MITKKSTEQKILLAPSSFGVVSEKPMEELSVKGFDIVRNPYGRTLDSSELQSLLSDCVGVIAGTEDYNLSILKNSKNLKIISRLGVGIDNINLDYARKANINVTWCSTSPASSVAELVLGLFINLSRNLIQMHNNLKSGVWKKEMGILLTGKTVGLIGLGNIGKRFVEITQGFNFKYLAYDLHEDRKFSERYGVQYVNLESLLNESNFISIHLNNSEENTNFINEEKFGLMKQSPILVNTSRGNILDEEAIKTALIDKTISGLGLDVFKQEPYEPDKDFLKHNNVIFTPHIGSYAKEIREQMELEAVFNLLSFIK